MNSQTAHRIIELKKSNSWVPQNILATVWPPSPLNKIYLNEKLTVLPLTRRETTGEVFRVQTSQKLKQVAAYEGPCFMVGSTPEMLNVGDLIISSLIAKAIVVTPELLGIRFSRHHLAFRGDRQSVTSLWAFVNSPTGANILHNSRTVEKYQHFIARDILEIGGLELSEVVFKSLNQLAFSIQFHIDRDGTKRKTETWWRQVDLREESWEHVISTPNPEYLTDGLPLADLVDIKTGRNRGFEIEEKTSSESLPVANATFVRNNEVNRWFDPTDIDHKRHFVEEGELLVTVTPNGLKTRVAPSNMVLGMYVAAISPKGKTRLENIEGFLESEEASEKWMMLNFNSLVAGASVRNLNRLTLSQDLSTYKKARIELGPDIKVEKEAEVWLWNNK